MFTGLIEGVGTVSTLEHSGAGVTLRIGTPLAEQLAKGDSIAVNGVCLTATEVADESFAAQVMNETLDHSSLGELGGGAQVNLELPLRAGERLGGHVVQGHVDGTGTVSDVRDEGFSRVLEIELDPALARYIVQKGSVAVDGVSLTVSHADEHGFEVSLIPETLTRTNLCKVGKGTPVNVEVDILAKHAERLLKDRG